MQVFWDKSLLPNEAGRANRAATWIPKSGSQSQSRQIEIDTFLCCVRSRSLPLTEKLHQQEQPTTPAAAATAAAAPDLSNTNDGGYHI